jgi:GGDEF domain-containing protein
LIPAFRIAGRRIHISASVGISVNTAGYCDAEEMLRDADAAMYRSKAIWKPRRVRKANADRRLDRRAAGRPDIYR